MLQVVAEGRGENVGVDVEGEGDDGHCDQHDEARGCHSELALLVGLVVQQVGQQHRRQRQPKHQISAYFHNYIDKFLPAMASSLISWTSEEVMCLSAGSTGLFSEM